MLGRSASAASLLIVAMRRHRWVLASLAVVIGQLVISTEPAHSYIYWSNTGGGNAIARANNDGTGVNEQFIPNAGVPGELAVDSSHVYWARYSSDKIGRANLDGTSPDPNFMTALNPIGIATNSTHVFWLDGISQKIGRANLNGTSPNTDFVTGVANGCGLAANAGNLYWGDTSNASIERVSISGGTPSTNFIPAAGTVPCNPTTTPTNIYWVDIAIAGKVGRANVNGTSPEPSYIGGITSVCGVAVDSSFIYWGSGDIKIGRALLDASVVDYNFIPTSHAPCGMVIDALGPPPPAPPGPGGGTAPTASPSNKFTFGKVKLNRKRGTGTVTATVPGAGSLKLSGKNTKTVTKNAAAAGPVTLTVAATGKSKRRLRRKHKARLSFKIVFTPTGGTTSERPLSATLRLRR